MAKMDWSKLKQEVQKSSEAKKDFNDSRMWKPKVDEKGNALAIIRFLPDPNGEVWSKVYSHGFKYGDPSTGATRWYIKNCTSTFGFDQSSCPICSKNGELWNSAFESDKKLASERKRKLHYISNVYIVKDPANPENEGKVMLYQYGMKIHEKIKRRIFPTDQDREDPDFAEFVPFDPAEGANFKLKVKKVGEFPNYDDSEFSPQSPLAEGNEKKVNAILTQCYDLSEFTAKDKFPSNEEVVKLLGHVLGIVSTDEAPVQAPKPKAVTKPVKEDEDDDEPVVKPSKPAASSGSDDDLDEDLKFFEDL